MIASCIPTNDMRSLPTSIFQLKRVRLLAVVTCAALVSIACQSAETGVAPSTSSPIATQATAALVISTPEPTPIPRASLAPIVTLTPTDNIKSITLTVVYDNRSADPRLGTAWGFACLIETEATTILFDTGDDGRMLLDNLETLRVDPQAIDLVVLSHIHSDHTGGLDQLLAANNHLTVYLPQSFPAGFKAQIHNPVVEVSEPITIADHIRTTGELGTAIIEQALIIETRQGLIVLTGCAHPGIVEIVHQAKTYGAIDLVMGGFHLADYSAAQVEAVIAELKRSGVQRAAPGHCTGDRAIEQFHAAFDTNFVSIGAGTVLQAEQ